MDEPGVARRGLARQHADGRRVDGARELGLGLGLVDRGVGRGIDDELRRGGADRARAARPGRAKSSRQGGGAVDVDRDHLAEQRQRALQLPADLSVLAEQQDLHAGRCP